MSVFLRVPTAYQVDRELSRWLLWAETRWEVDDIDIYQSNFGPAEARNDIVRLFLATNHTHLWMVDADVVPPRSEALLERFITHDKPVVSGLYKGYSGNGRGYWHVWAPVAGKGRWVPWKEAKWPDKDLFRAPAVGTGCMLIAREVLEQGREDPFYYTMLPGGAKIGEDANFCRDVGGVWVDKRFRCRHYQTIDLGELPE